jgi:Bacterial SH3 domain
MARWKLLGGGVIILSLMLACGGIEVVVTPGPSSPPVSFTPIPTLTPTIVLQPTPAPLIPSPPATSTLGAGPFTPYFATTSAENVNLRTEPGTLFPVSRLLAKGTRLQVLGHAPGGEWLYVQTDTHIYGWVLYALLDGGQDHGPTPLVQPQNVLSVKGRIADLAGVPISGIGFAITQMKGTRELRGDATSDSSGQFYEYLPMTAVGQWAVRYVSVACTSNTMDAGCNCIGGKCGMPDPAVVPVTLPFNGELQFVWK